MTLCSGTGTTTVACDLLHDFALPCKTKMLLRAIPGSEPDLTSISETEPNQS